MHFRIQSIRTYVIPLLVRTKYLHTVLHKFTYCTVGSKVRYVQVQYIQKPSCCSTAVFTKDAVLLGLCIPGMFSKISRVVRRRFFFCERFSTHDVPYETVVIVFF